MKREVFMGLFSQYCNIDIVDIPWETEKFKVWFYDEEVFLLDKVNVHICNWYKRYHIGRTLMISKELENERTMREFLTKANEEYNEYKEDL